MNKSAIIVMLAVFFLLPDLAAAGFTDNGNGTVTDTVTNLMWQKCSAGQNNDASCTGTASTYQWDGPTTFAISYCEGLSLGGFTDWRLPNIKELRSVVDSTKAIAPAINTTYFSATVSSLYWSSTTYAPDNTWAWDVNFVSGYVGYSTKTSTCYVRCVR